MKKINPKINTFSGYSSISTKLIIVVLLIISIFTIVLSVSVAMTSYSKFSDITTHELDRMSAILAKQFEELEKKSYRLVNSFKTNNIFLDQIKQLVTKGPTHAQDIALINRKIEDSEMIYFFQAQLRIINILQPIIEQNNLDNVVIYLSSPFDMIKDLNPIPVLKITKYNFFVRKFLKKGEVNSSLWYKTSSRNYNPPSSDYFDISSVYSKPVTTFFDDMGFEITDNINIPFSNFKLGIFGEIGSDISTNEEFPIFKSWSSLSSIIANPETFEEEKVTTSFIMIEQNISNSRIKQLSNDLDMKIGLAYKEKLLIPKIDTNNDNLLLNKGKNEIIINNVNYFFSKSKIALKRTNHFEAITMSPVSILRENTISLATQIGITGIVVIIIAGIIIFYLVGAHIKDPLKKLMDGVSQISDGKFKSEVNIHSKDELGKLANAFNEMAFSLNNKTTDLYNTVSELENVQNYISNILDSMPSILIGVDINGKITQWNKTAENITGVTVENAKGNLLSDIFMDMTSEMENIFESIKTMKIIKEQNKERKTDTGNKFEDITIYPLVTDEIKGAVIRIDDVTKEHDLELQLSQSRKMDAIGQLAGGVAHDFNNMLAGIQGAAQLLQLPSRKLDEKSLNFVDMILKATGRAADLTAKLLAFGRKGNVASTPINIHSIINDTKAIFDRTIDKKINISISQKAENYTVIGDDSMIQSAFMNLGINAAHAMPDGGNLTIETNNIDLDERYCNASQFEIKPGKYIEVSISDTGTGISLDNIKKIFEPFFTTKKLGKGTGLGLAAVYGTIKNHNGAITVYSEIGVGTVFHIYIPCSDDHVIKTEETEVEIQKDSGMILLVDDEEIIRITGKGMLEEIGYNVIVAENGSEAVSLFKNLHKEIDIVIMDMIMPIMNGREAFNKMIEINKNSKIIIASGFTKDGSLDDMKRQGLAGFIRKPYTNYELSLLINKIKNS